MTEPQDDTFEEIVADALVREGHGEAVDREELIKQHPDLAHSLHAFFANHDRLRDLAGGADPTTSAGVGSSGPKRTSAGGALEATTLGSVDEELGAGERPVICAQTRHFGDYELLDEIARGGMGVVYRARQVNLNRIVALKMILAGRLASQEDVKRFRVEAEAAAHLDHPGIVPIYDISSVDGQYYYTMGFVEGVRLDQLSIEELRDPRRAARIVKQLAEAVEYAHKHGIVHRDLKPANVLLDQDGSPKITDFGLAKRMELAADLTRTGQILGTPGYMAPEQAAGESKLIGTPADIYALGGLLYFLLTRRPPFQAANVIDTLVQSLESEPTLPSRVSKVVPRQLEQICMRCLEREPSNRYPSAAHIAADLDRFLQGQPIQARPPTAVEQLRRFTRRAPALTVHVAVISLLIVIAQARYLIVGADQTLHVKIISTLTIWIGFAWLLHLISRSDRSEHVAGTALLCIDAVMITVVLSLMCEPGSPPGPLLIGYPLIVVAGAMFFYVRRVVIVTIAAAASYLCLLWLEPYLVEPAHYHICFLVMLGAIAFSLVHQVRRVRMLSDYFEYQR
ncbi:serine/threonine-protein kinase [Planctomycetaceae bacterium SH139]